MSYKFDIEPSDQNEMARKLSYKYEIEKQENSHTSKVSFKFDSPVCLIVGSTINSHWQKIPKYLE